MGHRVLTAQKNVAFVGKEEESGRELLLSSQHERGPAPLNGSMITDRCYKYVVPGTGTEIAEELATARLTTRTSTTGLSQGLPLDEIVVQEPEGLNLRLSGISNLTLDQKQLCVAAICKLVTELEEGL